jgi:hypothetical protein
MPKRPAQDVSQTDNTFVRDIQKEQYYCRYYLDLLSYGTSVSTVNRGGKRPWLALVQELFRQYAAEWRNCRNNHRSRRLANKIDHELCNSRETVYEDPGT